MRQVLGFFFNIWIIVILKQASVFAISIYINLLLLIPSITTAESRYFLHFLLVLAFYQQSFY